MGKKLSTRRGAVIAPPITTPNRESSIDDSEAGRDNPAPTPEYIFRQSTCKSDKLPFCRGTACRAPYHRGRSEGKRDEAKGTDCENVNLFAIIEK